MKVTTKIWMYLNKSIEKETQAIIYDADEVVIKGESRLKIQITVDRVSVTWADGSYKIIEL